MIDQPTDKSLRPVSPLLRPIHRCSIKEEVIAIIRDWVYCQPYRLSHNNHVMTHYFITFGYRFGSVVVDILFNVLPIVCGGSVLVFVLLCITLCLF